MSQSTQRPRYFDGEFLRSGDFTDEQSYHIAMRRLLNHELHLSGIVTGLHIVQDQNSVPSTTALFYSVAPGFAIDQIGREIYVSAPYSLTPLLSTPGLTNGWHELWIVYTETQSGSPAGGYQLCNQPSQNTRWTESFNVVLRFTAAPPDPNVPDPNHDLKGICLGVLGVKYDSINGWSFFAPSDWYKRRTYAEIRAQSIIAPDNVEPDYITLFGPNTVLPPEGYLQIRTHDGVYTQGNMLVQKNILVGDDFTIQNTNPAGTAPGPTYSTGNLKLYSDLYLNGQLYTRSNGNWVTLDTHIKNSAGPPDIQLVNTVGSSSIPIVIPINGGIGIKTQAVMVTTHLPTITKVDVQASITGVTFVDGSAVEPFFTTANISLGGLSTLTASAGAAPYVSPVTITISCLVTGGSTGGTTSSLFDTVEVGLVVIFRP